MAGSLPPGWEEQALAGASAATGGGPDTSGEPVREPEPRSWELRVGAGLLVAVLVFGAVAGIVYALVLR